MPKMKTHRGAAKRFKATAHGRFKKKSGYRNHMLGKKSPKQKRQLRQPALVSERDEDRLNRMLPYA